MDSQKKFQEEQFVNLGKQLHEKEIREKRFKDNLEFLENIFTEKYQHIKMKKEQVYTESVPEMIEKLYDTYDLDCDETDLVLYIKFLKFIIKQKDNEIKKEQETIEDLNEMSNSYLEEIKELEEKDKKNNDELLFRKYTINTLIFLGIYSTVNFTLLYFLGKNTFEEIWMYNITTVGYFLYNIFTFIFYVIQHTWIPLLLLSLSYGLFYYLKMNYFNKNKND